MLFDKQLFESKYVEPDKRVHVDTLLKRFGVKEVNEYHIHEAAYILCTACRENPEGD